MGKGACMPPAASSSLTIRKGPPTFARRGIASFSFFLPPNAPIVRARRRFPSELDAAAATHDALLSAYTASAALERRRLGGFRDEEWTDDTVYSPEESTAGVASTSHCVIVQDAGSSCAAI